MLRKAFFFVGFCFLVLGVVYGYYYIQWKHLWQLCPSYTVYRIEHHDDTLRILVIGDSWAEMHSDLNMDTFLCSRLRKEVDCPVSVVSKGKGGEKTRKIYQMMFESKGDGTKPLFESGADYCVIFAGINDAAANWGAKQYCYHYRLIIDFLLHNNIRPVVIEIPDVDIWNVYKDKHTKDKLADFVKSTMTRCVMYNYSEYREALYDMLEKDKLFDKVVFVPMTKWNGNGVMINPFLYMEDRVHLNNEGYKKLDESIAIAIANNLNLSKDTAFINNRMHQNSQ